MGSDSGEKCNKKTNLLVYQSPSGQRTERNNRLCPEDCKQPAYKAPICAPRPKQIRVCTGAELKKMCPPKICPCPRERRGNALLTLLGFLLKTAVAAGAVYVSYDLGVWGTTEDTHQMYRAYCNILSEPNIERARKWDPPSCEAEKDLFQIPRFNPHAHCEKPPIDLEEQSTNFQIYWNRTIEFIFEGLAGFPNNMVNAIQNWKKPEKKECVRMDKEEIIENKYEK